MKIFSKEHIYEADKRTVASQNITSTDLMERAGIEVFNWLHGRMQGAPVLIHVFCGIGNNGGDGLVLSRHLVMDGYNVKTYVVNCSDKRSKDFLINYDRIKNVTKDWPILLSCKEEFPEIGRDDIIVDAIFGIGLNRPADDWVKLLFQHFRASKAFTLSIDICSGLYSDKALEDENGVVWADFVLSFQSPKLVFFLPETGKFIKQWDVLDIGLDAEYLSSAKTEAYLIGKYDVLPLYRSRDKYAHKGDFGHSLIIGGSYGKIGAVTLASTAALKIGAGLVTAYVPKCGYSILQTAFPEAMVITDNEQDFISNIEFEISPTVIALGIGIGTHAKTIAAFETFLKQNKLPLVIDADGINMISKKKSLLKLLPKNTVLTPHPKELERLIGTWKDDFDKLKKVKLFSKKHNLVIVVKGAHTIVVNKEELFINSTGNPGMATAGSGDVLTGIICGLISQRYAPLEASLVGVYLHGIAGDFAASDGGFEALIASDIIDYIGEAYLDLFKMPNKTQLKEEKKEDSKGEELYI